MTWKKTRRHIENILLFIERGTQQYGTYFIKKRRPLFFSRIPDELINLDLCQPPQQSDRDLRFGWTALSHPSLTAGDSAFATSPLAAWKISGEPVKDLEERLRVYDARHPFVRFFIRLFSAIEKRRALLIYLKIRLAVFNLLQALQNDTARGEEIFDRLLASWKPELSTFIKKLSRFSLLRPWLTALWALTLKPVRGTALDQEQIAAALGPYRKVLKQGGFEGLFYRLGYFGAPVSTNQVSTILLGENTPLDKPVWLARWEEDNRSACAQLRLSVKGDEARLKEAAEAIQAQLRQLEPSIIDYLTTAPSAEIGVARCLQVMKVLGRVFRIQSRLFHPDRSEIKLPEDFVAVQAAFERLKTTVEQRLKHYQFTVKFEEINSYFMPLSQERVLNELDRQLSRSQSVALFGKRAQTKAFVARQERLEAEARLEAAEREIAALKAALAAQGVPLPPTTHRGADPRFYARPAASTSHEETPAPAAPTPPSSSTRGPQ